MFAAAFLGDTQRLATYQSKGDTQEEEGCRGNVVHCCHRIQAQTPSLEKDLDQHQSRRLRCNRKELKHHADDYKVDLPVGRNYYADGDDDHVDQGLGVV